MANWIESSSLWNSPVTPATFNAIGIVENSSLTSPASLDPLNITSGWSAVLAMLILAFPEIHWVILSPYVCDDTVLRKAHFPRMTNLLADLHDVMRQHNQGFAALFDPAGLRHQVRLQLARRADTRYVPLRKECAVAIDDEESYAYLNAYICYRFGFRSHVVTSYSMMNRVATTTDQSKLALSFEDLYLNFADKRQSLSSIEKRDETFTKLKSIPRRIFVTAGHEGDTWSANIDYLIGRWTAAKVAGHKPRWRLRLRRTHRPSDNWPTTAFAWVLYKPESGVFDVWNQSGLEHEFKDNGGKADGFNWPPKIDRQVPHSSHSAPGRLLLIADFMIHRAQHILKNADAVADTIRGATLALDAQEYLGYRTPTTSLDAVALKHQLEVQAECMFYGVEYHLDTKRRFAEIRSEMDSASAWFRSTTRDVSKVNANLGIVSDLVRIYRNFNQFDEEQAGLIELRHLCRSLWLKRNRSWAWLFWLPRWYIDHLLNSISTFAIVILGWLLVFGTLYAKLPPHNGEHAVKSRLAHGFEDAIVTFFGLQPPHELFDLEKSGLAVVWVTMFLIIMSFLHLGVFVSHLYALTTRR
ncbi:MAG: hypothetical protein ACXWID_01615 [Pyrinomonadaceae bacterium]